MPKDNVEKKAGLALQVPNNSLQKELGARLIDFEDQLYNLHHSQYFYQQAVLTLTAVEDDPNHWLIGATVINRHLQEQGDTVRQQLQDIRLWLENQS